MGRRILRRRGFHHRLLSKQEEESLHATTSNGAAERRGRSSGSPPSLPSCDARDGKDRRSERRRNLRMEDARIRGDPGDDCAAMALSGCGKANSSQCGDSGSPGWLSKRSPQSETESPRLERSCHACGKPAPKARVKTTSTERGLLASSTPRAASVPITHGHGKVAPTGTGSVSPQRSTA